MPSHLTPIHIYLHHSGIPAHCKYWIGNDPVYRFILVFLVCFCSILCYFCDTFTLITALLDLQLARKAFHCACDIKTGTHTKDQSQRGKIINLNHCTQCICPTCFMTTNGVQAAWRTPFLSVVILPVTL